jgi:class 3 adenylate cyclase
MTKGGDHMLFVAAATRDAMREAPDDLEFVEEFDVRGREAKMRVYSIPDPVGSPVA